MSDPIRHDDLIDTTTIREANLLESALTEIIDGGDTRDEHVILIATAKTFLDACEYAEIDPLDALNQIADAYESGLLEGTDDPAQGRFVHSEVATRN